MIKTPILFSFASNDLQQQNARIIQANYLQIAKIANRFTNNRVLIEDLFSAGIIGLLKASDKFNPNKGTKLSTFAHFYIENEIRSTFYSLLSCGIMSSSDINNKNIIRNIINKLKLEGVNNPSYFDIAKASKFRFTSEYIESILSNDKVLSLDHVYYEDNDDYYSMIDTIALMENVDDELDDKRYEIRLHNKTKEMLSVLNQEEQNLINIYFNSGDCSFVKSARLLKCTVNHIKTLYYHAIRKIRLSNIKSFKEEDYFSDFS